MEQSFKQRVTDFWNTFEEDEIKIRQLINDQADSNILVGEMSSLLKTAFNDIPFEIGHNGEKHELILSPNGNKLILMQIRYLLRQRPKHLDELWNFYEAKPAMGTEEMELGIYDKRISPNDFTIYTKVDANRKNISIEVYIPLLKDLEENLQYNTLFMMLDLFIGEFYTMEYIGFVDIIENKKDQESIPLVKLKSYIEYLEAENEWNKNENPADNWTGYKAKEITDSNILREDVLIGYTSCFAFIRELNGEETHPLEQFKEDGIYMGYIFYNNSSIPQKEMVPQRSQIEDKINELVSQQGVAEGIGGATGSKNSYIDFIIYDLNSFLGITNKIMKDYNFTPKGFAFFDKPTQPTYF